MLRRTLAVAAGGLAAVVAVASPSLANWGTSGSTSSASTATTLQPVSNPAVAPTNGATSTSLTITWSAPASGPSPTGYQVTRTTGTPAVICTGSSTSCVDNGRTAGTSYSYSIVAVLSAWNSSGTASSGTTVTGTTLSVSAPAAGATGVGKLGPFSGSSTGANTGSTVTVNIYTGTNVNAAAIRTLTATTTSGGGWTVSLPANSGGSGRLANNTQYTMVASLSSAPSVSRTFTTGSND